MMTRVWAFGLWAAVAASVVYWGLKLFVPGLQAPAHTSVAVAAASPRGDLSRLFGTEAAPVAAVDEAEAPEADRFELIGVVAPRDGGAAREGLALIAVDGKPPRAYRVGAVVDGDTVLQGVGRRSASLGPSGGTANITLDIPPPAPAATGVPQPAAGAVALPPRPVTPPAFTPPQIARPQLPRALMRQPSASEPQSAPNDALQTD
jgi:general secretion pathway protein C